MVTASNALRIPLQKLDPLPKLLASVLRTIMAMPDPVLLVAPYVLTMVSLMLKQHRVPLSIQAASVLLTPMEQTP
jgi:ABC-type uncharacterized transport system permease subunit